LFNHILDEIVEKIRLAPEQLEGLWRIIQPADTEYKLIKIEPKPENILSLVVSDKDAWLSELNDQKSKVVRQPISEEWITLFEQRTLSQDETYKVPYRSMVLLHSSLIKKGALLSYEELEKESFNVLKLQKYEDSEFITLDQARTILTKNRYLTPAFHRSFLPVLTWKTNSPLFLGYREIVSLPYYLINQYGLIFKDFDLFQGEECVIKYEVWQEGYEDETYSRELLSSGTRLLINKRLLQKIFQDYNAELCQSLFEKRLSYTSKYEGKASAVNSVTTYSILQS